MNKFTVKNIETHLKEVINQYHWFTKEVPSYDASKWVVFALIDLLANIQGERIKRIEKPRKIKMKWFEDPGHAWLAVSRKEVERLGIADKISHCSFEKGEKVYLEEDSDAHIFLEAYFGNKDWYLSEDLKKEYQKIPTKINEKRHSAIRNYASYRAA